MWHWWLLIYFMFCIYYRWIIFFFNNPSLKMIFCIISVLSAYITLPNGGLKLSLSYIIQMGLICFKSSLGIIPSPSVKTIWLVFLFFEKARTAASRLVPPPLYTSKVLISFSFLIIPKCLAYHTNFNKLYRYCDGYW